MTTHESLVNITSSTPASSTAKSLPNQIAVFDSPYPTDKKLPEFEGYPFKLDHFQKWSVAAMLRDENVLVTAGTGSGKSFCAEFAIQQGVKKGKKVIYTSPIKSLSNQKFHEFTKKFGMLSKQTTNPISIGILTGDIKFNPEAQVLIMTTEILRNLLYHKEVPIDPVTGSVLTLDVQTEVSSVVFDEVHYINDRDRGKVWEECLILLPNHINLVLLSATIDQPEIFGQWLQEIKGKQLNLIKTHRRVIPLKHHLFLTVKGLGGGVMKKNGHKKLLEPREVDFIDRWIGKLVPLLETIEDGSQAGQAKFYENHYQAVMRIQRQYRSGVNHGEIFHDIAEYLHHHGMTPALFFVLSRRKCEDWARKVRLTLNTSEEQATVEKLINYHLHQLDQPEMYTHLGQFQRLKDLMVKGIAYHHSGLIPVLKEIIEILFAKNLIKILFATETFAVGVNMPTKTVVFTGLTKFNGVNDFRYLDAHEFRQMSGRAGRRGLDPIGHVVILPNLCDLPSATEMRTMMTGRVGSIRSQFTLNYAFLLKAILTENISLSKVLETSFMNQELKDRLLYLEKERGVVESQLPTEDFSDCQRYQELTSNYLPGSEGVIKLSQKQIKKNRRAARELKSRSDFHDKLARFEASLVVQTDYEKLLAEIDNCRFSIGQELRRVLWFLQELGYLVGSGSSSEDGKGTEGLVLDEQFQIEQLTPEMVTTRGVMASTINQCNELLLTELVIQGWLDQLTGPEICGVLAVFLDTKVETEIHSVGSLNGSGNNLCQCLEKLVRLADQWQSEEERRGLLSVGTDWRINLSMIPPALKWASGGSLDDALGLTGGFEGNLVKDMLKIGHLAEDVKSLAELVGKKELAALAMEIPKLVVREVVTVDSLYLKFHLNF